MHKLSRDTEDEQQYVHAATFALRKGQFGADRLVAGLPHGEPGVFLTLAEQLEDPLFILYVLHTPRGIGDAGRYQSPELSLNEVRDFVARYSSYLTSDSRFDLWVHSQSTNGTVVWDRHNLIHAYGPLQQFESVLRSMGFESGDPNISHPHVHHFRREYDEDAKSILAAFEWQQTPLQPEDEQ